ncbi:hypothetical protein NDU88_010216 [Pleurodeles waltl]|uniref:Uncharacterized protein n=1 Tax=Pleurodeles waltl TaxID=8319 RepID=A0AAV7S2M6_PLEWA|nr:hypothetical protein NDU88_010216 [Pleurodeles waltl]
MVEAQAATSQDRIQELLYLCSMLTDLEDRSRRDNVRFLGFPEAIKGKNTHSFLRVTLPKLTGITFDLPPLEFHRAHRLGPKRPRATTRPRPIIASLLRQMKGQEIRLSADFSKETSERRKAFLDLHPRLRQMEVKYGLFEPVRMWVTKNGVSQDFYDPEDLCSFLDSQLPMDTPAPIPPRDSSVTDQTTLSQGPSPGGSRSDRRPKVSHPRGRDLERLMNSHDDRGQVLHAVALHTQVADRDKPRSLLKPPADTP